MVTNRSNSEISTVVCTKNSISGIEKCLRSLRDAEVGEIIVVDANSTDGTAEIAHQYADLVLKDPGIGLGNARNLGIAASTKPYVLNMGSDNFISGADLGKMIDYLNKGGFHGVSAQTIIVGDNYVTHGLNLWRSGRFPEGERSVIGTPTLFIGDLLRAYPYDASRKFSDDSELCERWSTQFNSRFAISDATCFEMGKTSWPEVIVRAKMYGISDDEVFRNGNDQGWSKFRKIQSALHPLRSDFLTPLASNQPFKDKLASIPFLFSFTSIRYLTWLSKSFGNRHD